MWFKQQIIKAHTRIIHSAGRNIFSSLLLGLAGFIFLPTTALAVVENVTPFEWSMPDRLLVNTNIPGDPADPIPTYDPNALMLPPDGWTVNFNACAVSTSTIVSYQWFIDGVDAGTVTTCNFTHPFPEEASYQVTLTVTDDVGDTAVIEETITVQDWLIIAMGDSYGSGEGNPEIPVSAQAHVDFSVLFDLADNVRADLDAAIGQLPGLEDAQAAAQQLRDDAQATRTQAAADLTRLQQDLQNLIVIRTNVENEPEVILARNNLIAAEQWASEAQASYVAALADYNNCTFLNCAARLVILLAAVTELEAAQANLTTAQALLYGARTEAVVRLSVIGTIQNFDALTIAIDTATLAVNAAQSTYNAANNAYQNAQTALQDAINAVASLQSIITDIQNAWNQARFNAQTQYLEHLPVWTETPPAWGKPEPTYAEIVLNGFEAGDALRCHRSMISGQARAALALEQADPHTSVTFVHLSCTGATIAEGVNGIYKGADIAAVIDPLLSRAIDANDNLLNFQCVDDEGNPVPCAMPSQLDAAKTTINGREIDAMVISVGGNDVKFSRIITECVLGQPCHADLPPVTDFGDELTAVIEENCNPVTYFNQATGLTLPSAWFPFSDKCLATYNLAETTISNGDALHTFDAYVYGQLGVNDNGEPFTPSSLQTKMGELNQAILAKFPGFDTRRVYITQYPDPTGDDLGNDCGWDPSQPPNGDGLKSIPGVTQAEAAWAAITVATALRDETAAAAQTNLWNFVSATGEGNDTIGTASRNHGYCADDHWIVRIPESLVSQQDLSGIMHPNRAGHDLYKKAIFTKLVADLYPAGISEPPRQPVEPPISNTPSPNGGGGGGGSIGWVTLLMLMIVGLFRRTLYYRDRQSS